jgi:hypothetical protein
MNPKPIALALCGFLAGVLSVSADEEASNRLYVRSGACGALYAKCIPAEAYGTKGRTLIFLAREKEDLLEETFDWYSTNTYLQHTAWGPSVVRFGPWPRGRLAAAEDLAIAFYLRGKLLKSYSTLDIARTPKNVRQSVSHYEVFSKITGYRWIDLNDYAFDVTTTDGRQLSFDVRTGELIPGKQPARQDDPANREQARHR